MHATEKIYSDANVEEIESLPPLQPHRPVDLLVVAADQEGEFERMKLPSALMELQLAGHIGYVRTYIIFPSAIYGLASNPLVEAGIQNPYSQLVHHLVRASIDRGQGGVIGLGKNIWPNVENGEQADLFMLIFDRARANPEDTPHGREGFFFGASGEHTLYDVSKRIAEVLFELGVGKTPEPTTFSDEEMLKYFGVSLLSKYALIDGSLTSLLGTQAQGSLLGSNARCRADRSLAIGWTPKKSTEDLLASIRPETELLLARVE
jgi:hypothetical protein